MQTHVNARWVKLAVAFLSLLAAVAASGLALAQDNGEPPQGTIEQFGHEAEGEWNHQDDGRLNTSTPMGGLNVYCVDQWKNSAHTFEGGGIQVLDPQGEEMLFVSEQTIVDGWATLQQTGQNVTLGLATRGWYGGAQIGLYLLTSGEYQLNATDEWAKPVEFRFTSCRNFTIDTNDGCSPGWDRDAGGVCVFRDIN